MNLARISDRIGSWNPQLLREIKGKFTSSSITVILIISGLIQSLGVLWLFSGNPSDRRFVLAFQLLNGLLPFIAIAGGIYAVVADLTREQKSGTFEFIRSSPQSGRSIFIGKIIGAPSLVYLAVLSCIPLHLAVAAANEASLCLMLAWYGTVGAIGYFGLTVTSLYILMGGRQAILLALLFSQPLSGAIGAYSYYLNASVTKQSWMALEPPRFLWFYLPISNNIWLFYSFNFITIVAACQWLWIAIDRKYIHPKTTVFKKAHSYSLTIASQIWLLGFALPMLVANNADRNFFSLAVCYAIGTVGVICTIPTILPNFKSMQEWSKTWQEQQLDGRYFSWRQPEIIRSLIWDERSPTLVAMAINVAIVAICWGALALGSFVLAPNLEYLAKFALGITVASIIVLFYTVAVHLLYLRAQLKNSGVIPLIFLMSSLPLVGGMFVLMGSQCGSMSQNLAYMLWLCSPLFWVGISQLSIPAIGLTMLAQIGISIRAIGIFHQKIHAIGVIQMEITRRQKLIGENI